MFIPTSPTGIPFWKIDVHKEFLGAWEMMYNPNFKVVKFDHFRKSVGLPTFTMSVTNWVEDTNAIGIYSKSGRYGGTYAHKDIALINTSQK